MRGPRILVLALLLVAAVALPAGPAQGRTAKVEVQDFGFFSDEVHVFADDEVSWVNTGAYRHSVSTDEGVPEAFDSGFLDQGGSFARVFTALGAYTYHCTVHNSMKGVVHVSARPATTTTSSTTTTTRPASTAGPPAERRDPDSQSPAWRPAPRWQPPAERPAPNPQPRPGAAAPPPPAEEAPRPASDGQAAPTGQSGYQDSSPLPAPAERPEPAAFRPSQPAGIGGRLPQPPALTSPDDLGPPPPALPEDSAEAALDPGEPSTEAAATTTDDDDVLDDKTTPVRPDGFAIPPQAPTRSRKTALAGMLLMAMATVAYAGGWARRQRREARRRRGKARANRTDFEDGWNG